MLTLKISDFRDPDHWAWTLHDAAGALIANHTVNFDTGDERHGGWIDLDRYTARPGTAAPRRWTAAETGRLAAFGDWLGDQLFGPAGNKILAQAPAVVRVVVPDSAAALMFRPLEAARLGGRRLVVHGLTLVYTRADATAPAARPAAPDRLRALAVFSLPLGTTAINLRRERRMLQELGRNLRAGGRRAALEVRVLHYGTTRRTLERALADGAGWDIVHLSGHGSPGRLVLEAEDGRPEPIDAAELVELVWWTRHRLALVTLSACDTAAAPSWDPPVGPATDPVIGSDDGVDAGSGAGVPGPGCAGSPLAALAPVLMRRIGCAVVGMRFAVRNEFAAGFGARLYQGVLADRQPLPTALARAVTATVDTLGADQVGLSAVAPALFGDAAATLSLALPCGPAAPLPPPGSGLIRLPAPPRVFVGRVAELGRASAALAPASDRAAVLLTGPAGIGKTGCAQELADHLAATDRFQAAAWWTAPTAGSDLASALHTLARTWEAAFGDDFKMSHAIADPAALRSWLVWLKAALETRAVLIALDNLDSLVADDGRWWDPVWGDLIASLCDHRGLTRTILTSRIALPDLPAGRVETIPVGPLGPDETKLWVRDQPNLWRLVTSGRDGAALVRRVLEAAEGHPALLALAEARAADPEALLRRVGQAEAARQGGAPSLDQIFGGERDRAGAGRPGDPGALGAWAGAITAALPPASRILFEFLCGLEDADRSDGVAADAWSLVWDTLRERGLIPAELPVDAPGFAATLAPVVAATLVDPAESDRDDGAAPDPAPRLTILPGVAEAVRARVGDAVREAIAAAMAGYWSAIKIDADHRAPNPWAAGDAVGRAALAAIPYLLRRGDWDAAVRLVHDLLARGMSSSALSVLVRLSERIAAAAAGTDGELICRGARASVLLRAARFAEAEPELRHVLTEAAATGQVGLASVMAGDLIVLLQATGRPAAALPVVEERKRQVVRAGLGPWTRLSVEVRRLQIMNSLGRHREVLDAVAGLRSEMVGLPETAGPREAAVPWNVRETILDAGHDAAMRLKDWESALAFLDDIAVAERARGAPALEQARTLYNRASPLLSLGRHGEARAALESCRAVVEPAGDYEVLGRVLGGLAELESALGDDAAARRYTEEGLRVSYAGDAHKDCAISHFNLATYLGETGGVREVALAHRLAALAIAELIGVADLRSWRSAVTNDLAGLGTEAAAGWPADFAALCARVDTVAGVRFAALFDRISIGRLTGDAWLARARARFLRTRPRRRLSSRPHGARG